jgi:ubiquinol-cytochrome c reductase cytochrome b subunit
MALHEHGSSNPLGISSNMDKIYFHPYYTIKDLYAFILFFILYALLVFYFPNILNHPDNYIPANPLVTPLSIVPEWYLLVPYAILRTIPSKILGVLALASSLLVLFSLPLQSTYAIRSYSLRSHSRFFFWFFVGAYMILTVSGALAISFEVIVLSVIAAIYYFSFFLIILPLTHFFDSILFIYSLKNK